MGDPLGALAEKISEYNLFNYLLPGSVFLVSWRYVSGAVPFENSILLFLISAYFLGMVLSRIGSLVIEPVLLWARFVRFCDYGEFVRAEVMDPKLTTLSQENNTYRSMTAVFCVLLLAKAALLVRPQFALWDRAAGWGCLVALLVLFACSHRKQCRYIVKRVKATMK